MLLNSKIIIIIFVIFLIISIIIPYNIKTEDYKKGKIFLFFYILGGFAIFFTFLNYYNLFELQIIEQKLKLVEELRLIKKSVINDIFKEIDKSINIIPNFIQSITPLQNYNISNTHLNYKVNDNDIRIFTLSFRIFSLWEDFMLSKEILKINSLNYIVFFLQFANSKQLYNQWLIQKNNFSKNTITIGDELFYYSLNIKNQDINEYINNAKELINNNKLLK